MEQIKQILWIDDGSITKERFFNEHLEEAGFHVNCVRSFKEAWMLLLSHPDTFSLIFLPVGGITQGVNEIRVFRRFGVKTPIFAFSQKLPSTHYNAQIVVESLHAGADDCQPIPFNSDEWTERVKALLRRGSIFQEQIIDYGRIHIHVTSKRVLVDGVDIRLTTNEMKLVSSLAKNVGACLSKEQIFNQMYTRSCDAPGIKIVDVFVCKVRKEFAEALGIKNKDTPIRTVWGIGYQLMNPDEWSSLVAFP